MTSTKKPAPKSPGSSKTAAKLAVKPAAVKKTTSSKNSGRPISSSKSRSSSQASRSKSGSQLSSRKVDGIFPKKPTHPKKTKIEGVSLDRKLDVLGIALTFLGILTLLSMVSRIKGSMTGGWSSFLRLAFGWGSWVFPAMLILVGLWLILRNFERVPRLAVGRVLGFVLLYWNGLTILHFAATYTEKMSPLALAQTGQAGGYVGGFAANLLIFGLGVGGAVIVIAAWLLISLGLALDISIAELFKALSSLFNRLQDWMIEIMPEKPSPVSMPRTQPSPFPGIRPIPQSSEHPGNVGADSGLAPAGFDRPESLSAVEPPAVQWQIPPIESILDEGDKINYNDAVDLQRARLIEETLLHLAHLVLS